MGIQKPLVGARALIGTTSTFDRKSWSLSEFNSWYFNRRIWSLSHHLARAIPGRGTVLDIGSGDGQLALALMRLRSDLHVQGVDVVLRKRTMIPVTLYDGLILPFADKSFEYVTIVDVLHHTTDPAIVLSEASRVARRGVVVKDHLREGLLAQTTLTLMDWCGNVGDGVPMPYNFLDSAQWDSAFRRARLNPLETVERLGIYLPPFSWLLERRLQFMSVLAPQPMRRASFTGGLSSHIG